MRVYECIHAVNVCLAWAGPASGPRAALVVRVGGGGWGSRHGAVPRPGPYTHPLHEPIVYMHVCVYYSTLLHIITTILFHINLCNRVLSYIITRSLSSCYLCV